MPYTSDPTLSGMLASGADSSEGFIAHYSGEFNVRWTSGKQNLAVATKKRIWDGTEDSAAVTSFVSAAIRNYHETKVLQVNLFADSGGASPLGVTLEVLPNSSINFGGKCYNGAIAGAVSSIANIDTLNDTWDAVEVFYPSGGSAGAYEMVIFDGEV